MSQSLETPKRRESLTRVLPRRRGETTATTIVLAPDPVPAPVVSPPLQIRSIAPPPAISPAEQALRASLADSRVKGKYEQLADSLLASASKSGCHCISLFTTTASPASADVLSKLALVLSDRKLGRVHLLHEDSTFQDLARRFETQSQNLRESRAARQQLRIRLDTLKFNSRIVLCDGGNPGSPLGQHLAQVCDACYLLVEFGKTDALAAQAAIASLRKSGANVPGCVAVESDS